jgi:hypothetical protein
MVIEPPDTLPDVDRSAPTLDGYDQLLTATGDTRHGTNGDAAHSTDAATGEVAW